MDTCLPAGKVKQTVSKEWRPTTATLQIVWPNCQRKRDGLIILSVFISSSTALPFSPVACLQVIFT